MLTVFLKCGNGSYPRNFTGFAIWKSKAAKNTLPVMSLEEAEFPQNHQVGIYYFNPV